MSYTTYDFSEALQIVGIARTAIDTVHFAWGHNDDGWDGGFIFTLKDGRKMVLTGWCDYTGWGCQDGAVLEEMTAETPNPWTDKHDVDEDPADLNRWVVATAEDAKRLMWE